MERYFDGIPNIYNPIFIDNSNLLDCTMRRAYRGFGPSYRIRDEKILRLYRELGTFIAVARIVNMSDSQVARIVKKMEGHD
jgi:PII-like signaling protein